MNKLYTILVQITYPFEPGGSDIVSRTTTINDFPCENHPDRDGDEDCIWEQTLMELFFQQLKSFELLNFLKCWKSSHKENPDLIELAKGANKLKRLNNCKDIVELYRIRFNATEVNIVILEQEHTTENNESPMVTSILLEDRYNNLKPLKL